MKHIKLDSEAETTLQTLFHSGRLLRRRRGKIKYLHKLSLIMDSIKIRTAMKKHVVGQLNDFLEGSYNEYSRVCSC